MRRASQTSLVGELSVQMWTCPSQSAEGCLWFGFCWSSFAPGCRFLFQMPCLHSGFCRCKAVAQALSHQTRLPSLALRWSPLLSGQEQGDPRAQIRQCQPLPFSRYRVHSVPSEATVPAPWEAGLAFAPFHSEGQLRSIARAI